MPGSLVVYLDFDIVIEIDIVVIAIGLELDVRLVVFDHGAAGA